MVARGERFLPESFGVPAGVLAMFMVKAASAPELKAAAIEIAHAMENLMA
jgi:hypothetical protein